MDARTVIWVPEGLCACLTENSSRRVVLLRGEEKVRTYGSSSIECIVDGNVHMHGLDICGHILQKISSQL